MTAPDDTLPHYRRSSKGIVHRSDCSYGGAPKGTHWAFVDGLSHAGVMGVIADYPWLKPCDYCMWDEL